MTIRENISHLFSRSQKTVIELTEKIWSLTGALRLLQSILPKEVGAILSKFFLYRVGSFFNLYSEMKIEELNKSNDYGLNSLYFMAEEYVGNLESITEARRLCLSDIAFSNKDGMRISPDNGEVIWDCFQGVTVWWTMSKTKTFINKHSSLESHILTVRAKNPDIDFFHAYFSHIERSSTNYTKTDNNLVISLNNKHSKEFNERIGRSWKRGYFLYGPPGTGKTSLVAAIAKYMKYDLFELKLSKVKDNSELRQLLGKTWNKSVIIIDMQSNVALPRTRTAHFLRQTDL
ncbi:AAA-ATPase At4g25835-like [Cryptomeria japonica]|uniref:AAA-ATPase At4g25835-like n=1 Tax=Cryptomeria japonica TaxID=3369 RepID=UPI0027DA4D54|nr:AAA-ATPase At4g25835-like [Cryptomeria japonica]